MFLCESAILLGAYYIKNGGKVLILDSVVVYIGVIYWKKWYIDLDIKKVVKLLSFDHFVILNTSWEYQLKWIVAHYFYNCNRYFTKFTYVLLLYV